MESPLVRWLPLLASAVGTAGLVSVAGAWEDISRPERPDAAAQEAAGLYRRLCARCHSEDGSGRGKSSRTPLPDLASVEWQKKRSDKQILASLLNGMGSDMPSFDDRITPKQARDLVRFIRTLGPQPLAQANGDSFEASFHRLQREFEDLTQQIRNLENKR